MLKRVSTLFSIIIIASGLNSDLFAKDLSAKFKYGSQAVPLSQSHEYLTKSPAPSFWALMPYYLGQQTGSTCSVATTAMVVNAARAGIVLRADQKLATEKDLLEKVDHGAWKKDLSQLTHGVSLDELKPLLEKSFEVYGIPMPTIKVVHMDASSVSVKAELRKSLTELRTSKKTLIIANFLQGSYTGDAPVGHFAPVGAYDAAQKRVLILDPDHDWYEPYWIDESLFIEGMATKDSDSDQMRGYLKVELK